MRLKDAVSGIAGSFLRHVPIQQWPRPFSRLTGVFAPRAVVAHPQPSPTGGANVKMLFELLDRTAALPGDIAECGVWRGRSLVAMSLYLQQKGVRKTLWGFDSFEGFDASIARDIELGGDHVREKKVGGFNDTSYALVERKLRAFGLRNARLQPGYFQQSLRKCEAKSFSFVHLDCDIYESYAVCLDYFYPAMVPGGVILFDEYNDPAWPGANRAVDEFFADKSDRPQKIVRDNFEKWLVVKT